MLIVNVFVKVKPEYLEALLIATKENAKNSLMEPGITRFDILQNTEDPCQIMINEVYRTQEDTAKHKKTAHYQIWKETVAEMIAAPRTKEIYQNIFPEEIGWE